MSKDKMSRIDEIQERYNRARKNPRVQQFGISIAVSDIGYLLGLIGEHPASELPKDTRNVIAYSSDQGWQKAFFDRGLGWYGGHKQGHKLDDVICWHELPPVPPEYKKDDGDE